MQPSFTLLQAATLAAFSGNAEASGSGTRGGRVHYPMVEGQAPANAPRQISYAPPSDDLPSLEDPPQPESQNYPSFISSMMIDKPVSELFSPLQKTSPSLRTNTILFIIRHLYARVQLPWDSHMIAVQSEIGLCENREAFIAGLKERIGWAWEDGGYLTVGLDEAAGAGGEVGNEPTRKEIEELTRQAERKAREVEAGLGKVVDHCFPKAEAIPVVPSASSSPNRSSAGCHGSDLASV